MSVISLMLKSMELNIIFGERHKELPFDFIFNFYERTHAERSFGNPGASKHTYVFCTFTLA